MSEAFSVRTGISARNGKFEEKLVGIRGEEDFSRQPNSAADSSSVLLHKLR